MTPEAQQLVATVEQLASLLREYPEPPWTDWFTHADALLRTGQLREGARHVRGAYGGMGSFNEAVLPGANETEYQRFDRLRKAAWEQAVEVEHQESRVGRLLRWIRAQ